PTAIAARGRRQQVSKHALSLPACCRCCCCSVCCRQQPSRRRQQDLYSVLGVSRSATPQEVKQAYKRLARANHPDKSRDPWRLGQIRPHQRGLRDPVRCQQAAAEYDMFGTVQADPRHPSFHSFHASPFAEFFHQHQQHSDEAGGPRAGAADHPAPVSGAPGAGFVAPAGPSIRHSRLLLSLHASRPAVAPRLAEDLLPLGVPMAVVHAGMSSNLAEILRIDQVPAIIGVVDGVAYHYSGQLSLAGLRDFYRSLFPVDTLPRACRLGRGRLPVRLPLGRPPIRFLMAAYAWRSRLAFAYADTASSSVEAFRSARRLSGGLESVLLFDEDGEVGRLESARLETEALSAWLEARKHLALPRLASPELAEELCPAQMAYRGQISLRAAAAAARREARRWDRRRRDGAADSRVRLAYIHADSQLDFLRSLGSAEEPAASFAGRVLLLWRATASRARRLPLAGWPLGTLTVEQLRESIAAVAEDSLGLTVLASAPAFADESRPALPIRIWRRLPHPVRPGDAAPSRRRPSGPMLVVLTVAMVIGTAYIMTRLASGRSRSSARQIASRKATSIATGLAAALGQRRQTGAPSPFETAGRRPDNTRMLAELEPSNYRRLISASPQGQISLVLVVDSSLKAKLAADFARCLAPFASVERLRFAVLDVGERMGWYRAILEFVIGRKLGEQRVVSRETAPRTVLAVNGVPKVILHPAPTPLLRYFCILPPEKSGRPCSASSTAASSACHDSTNPPRTPRTTTDGEAATLKTTATTSTRRVATTAEASGTPLSEPDAPLFERDLLAGLPNWLDRAVRRPAARVRVDAWPESLDVDKGSPSSQLATLRIPARTAWWHSARPYRGPRGRTSSPRPLEGTSYGAPCRCWTIRPTQALGDNGEDLAGLAATAATALLKAAEKAAEDAAEGATAEGEANEAADGDGETIEARLRFETLRRP
uniref:J domain-containing protein n=1 Tax=Macrostomum lignano TaxID=282301 RepID=A0A1I8JRG0_9PLAT